MSLRMLVLLLIVLMLATFTALNWGAVTAPTTLSLLFATVRAPLGLILLAVTAMLAALFLAYLFYVQTTIILDARRTARELTAQRELADRAEASRFTELRAVFESRLAGLETAVTRTQAETGNRLDQLDADLRTAIETAANTLAAYIGEVEDRLEGRVGAGSAGVAS